MYCQIFESIRIFARFTKNSDIIKKFERYTRSVFSGERDGPLVSLPTTNSEVYK